MRKNLLKDEKRQERDYEQIKEVHIIFNPANIFPSFQLFLINSLFIAYSIPFVACMIISTASSMPTRSVLMIKSYPPMSVHCFSGIMPVMVGASRIYTVYFPG